MNLVAKVHIILDSCKHFANLFSMILDNQVYCPIFSTFCRLSPLFFVTLYSLNALSYLSNITS